MEALSEASRQAGQSVRLFPVPSAWLDPAEEQPSRHTLTSVKDALTELREAEARLPQEFEDGLVNVVGRDMRDRYRTDYQSWWRRLGGAWRNDQRSLHAELKSPRKLSLDESRQAVERAFEVKSLRERWAANESGFKERLGFRFQGRETDLEQLQSDFDETIVLRRGWHKDAGALYRLLTDGDSHEALQAALATARDAATRLTSSVEAIERPKLLKVSFESLTERAHRARPPLQAFVHAMSDLTGRFLIAPQDFHALASLVNKMAKLGEIEREDDQMASKIATDFGDRFTGPDTDWKAITSALAWTKQALGRAPSRLTEQLTGHISTPAVPGEYSEKATALRCTSQDFLGVLATVGEDFEVARTPWLAWCDAPFGELRHWAEDLSGHAESVADWMEYRAAVRDLEGDLGGEVVDRIRAVTDAATSVPGIIRRRICIGWLDRVYQSDPELKKFSARDHEQIREKFRELDGEQMEAAKRHVRQRCFEHYPNQYETPAQHGQLGILRGELSKRRRQMPVRKLFRRTPVILQALKPCMLMSPLAVSQYLPRGELETETIDFDVVIFDEASQVFPEDAVPAVARAKRTIVAGDKYQLPPTNFFRRARGDDDDTAEMDEYDEQDRLEGRESILDAIVGMAGDSVTEQYLTVHYRSRHEDLIRYSNHHFYDDRLLTFPAPGRETSGFGVRGVHVHGRFDAGASRTNRIEAEEVVKQVFATMRSRPERESIGVVALSRAQADLIGRLVDERRLWERDLDERFDEDRRECFFVKNLENVQGDERDHIILGIGYGPTTGSGAVPQRFGPISNEGGERRLNVAVSRARRSMTVVHSLRAEDINPEGAKNKGPRLLRRYLEYVRNPTGAFESSVDANPEVEPDSPFEGEVRRALEQRGHRVVSQVGVSGYRIDLGIKSENGMYFELGIECDGATYHSAPAARDRDRLRQNVLEGLGWRIHRVWSTSWVRDPGKEIAAIERSLDEARAVSALDAESRLKGIDIPNEPDVDPEDPSPHDPSRRLDPHEQTPLFDVYQEAPLADISIGDELISDVPRTMTALVRRVVEVEAPVHIDLLVERIRNRYGLRRAGNAIRDRIERGVKAAVQSGVVDRDGSFLRLPEKRDAAPRCPTPGISARKIEHISDCELDAGILLTVRYLYGSERDDLIAATAQKFGFKRTGHAIKNRIDQSIERLEERGRLNRQSKTLVASDSK